MLLKREIGPELLVVEAVMGAVLHGRESASLGQTRNSHVRRKFCFEFAPNRHHFGHDRATIAPRSGRDRGPCRPSIAV